MLRKWRAQGGKSMEGWERRSDGHRSILQYVLIIMFRFFWVRAIAFLRAGIALGRPSLLDSSDSCVELFLSLPIAYLRQLKTADVYEHSVEYAGSEPTSGILGHKPGTELAFPKAESHMLNQRSHTNLLVGSTSKWDTKWYYARQHLEPSECNRKNIVHVIVKTSCRFNLNLLGPAWLTFSLLVGLLTCFLIGRFGEACCSLQNACQSLLFCPSITFSNLRTAQPTLSKAAVQMPTFLSAGQRSAFFAGFAFALRPHLFWLVEDNPFLQGSNERHGDKWLGYLWRSKAGGERERERERARERER